MEHSSIIGNNMKMKKRVIGISIQQQRRVCKEEAGRFKKKLMER